MSKVEISIKSDELIKAMTRLAKALEANQTPTKNETVEKIVNEPKEEPIKIEKVRAVLAEKSQSGKQPEVKALITKYGAKKLTDIDPDCYEELLKEAEAL